MTKGGGIYHTDPVDIARLLPLLDRKDSALLSNVLDYLDSKYDGMDPSDYLTIPISSISKDVSAFQFVVKFLKENHGMPIAEIAKRLKRSRSTVHSTYKTATKRMKDVIDASVSGYDIPLGTLASKQSVLLSIVQYLHDDLELSYREIGEILKRDERTVWTVYNRGVMSR